MKYMHTKKSNAIAAIPPAVPPMTAPTLMLPVAATAVEEAGTVVAASEDVAPPVLRSPRPVPVFNAVVVFPLVRPVVVPVFVLVVEREEVVWLEDDEVVEEVC